MALGIPSTVDYLQKSKVMEPGTTRKKIEELYSKEENNNNIQTELVKLTLVCPITKTRMKVPIRGNCCKHLQCFDAEAHLGLAKNRPSYKRPTCPICSVEVPLFSLWADGYLIQVLESSLLKATTTEIELLEDGNWRPVEDESERPSEFVCIDLTEDSEPENDTSPEKSTSTPVANQSVATNPIPASSVPASSVPASSVPASSVPANPPSHREEKQIPTPPPSPPPSPPPVPPHPLPPLPSGSHQSSNDRSRFAHSTPIRRNLPISLNNFSGRNQASGTDRNSVETTPSPSRTPEEGSRVGAGQSLLDAQVRTFSNGNWVPYPSQHNLEGPSRQVPQFRWHEAFQNPYWRHQPQRPPRGFVSIPKSPYTIFVRGFPNELTRRDMVNFLSRFGRVTFFHVVPEVRTIYCEFYEYIKTFWIISELNRTWCRNCKLVAGRSYAPSKTFETVLV